MKTLHKVLSIIATASLFNGVWQITNTESTTDMTFWTVQTILVVVGCIAGKLNIESIKKSNEEE